MSLSTTIDLKVKVSQANNGDLNTAVSNTLIEKLLSLLNGTGANESNQAWSDKSQLAALAVDSHDLAGSMNDAFGNAITFTSITAILITANDSNVDNIEVGGNANAFASFVGGATEIIKVPPGGMLLITAPDATGFPVTAGTADVLDITNVDGAAVADYELLLVGRE